jgi:hypothetical protein
MCALVINQVNVFFFFLQLLVHTSFQKAILGKKKVEEEKNQIIQDPIVSNPIFKCQSGFVLCLNSTCRDLELAFFYFVNLRNLWEKKNCRFFVHSAFTTCVCSVFVSHVFVFCDADNYYRMSWHGINLDEFLCSGSNVCSDRTFIVSALYNQTIHQPMISTQKLNFSIALDANTTELLRHKLIAKGYIDLEVIGKSWAHVWFAGRHQVSIDPHYYRIYKHEEILDE